MINQSAFDCFFPIPPHNQNSIIIHQTNKSKNMRTSAAICLLASLAATEAFTVSTPSAARTQTALSADVSRNNFLKQVVGATGAAAFAGIMNPMAAYAEEVVTLPSGVKYEVVKSGDGPQPKVGELAGIRFRAKVVQSGNKIDDIFDTPEPYYTRIGSGGLIKGVEEVLPKMRLGDRWIITVPVSTRTHTFTDAMSLLL
jgi:FKBP-type peptidyl-prolyl cis-trans isomerase